jgi:Putative Ig domain
VVTPSSNNLAAVGGVTPYTWTVTTGALPPGLNLSNGGQIGGQPTATGTFNFTVQVADSANGTATASLSILVNAAAPLSVNSNSSSLPQGTINQAYPATNLSASGGIQPYSWSITSGVLPVGLTLSGTGQISGTPTASGTFNFTVKVADSNAPTANTATANLTLTVNANPCAGYGSGSESVLHGQYAFLSQGFVGTGALSGFAAAGSFAADGTGKITGGEVDLNESGGPGHVTVNSTGSSYVLGSDNRGCATLALSNSSSVTVHFAVGGVISSVATKGRVIEFDDTDGTGVRTSGIMRLQSTGDFSLSSLNSRYAFGLDGTNSTGAHEAIGGSFSVNTSGAISSGFADIDSGGTLMSGITGAAGSIGTISSTTGRATGSFNGGAGATFNWAYYVVNKNELFIIATDPQSASTPIVSGRAFVTGTSFSNSSLNGNYVLHLSANSGGSADVTLVLLNLSGGAANGTIYEYNPSGSGAKTQTISGASYSVDPNSGRVILTGAGQNPPVFYLTTSTDGISAIVVGADNSATFGFAEFQPSADYTNAVSGTYIVGTEDPSDNTISNDVGVVTVTGSTGAAVGTQDKSQPNSPFLATGQAINGTVTMNAAGVGSVGPNTVAITNGTRVFFIDESGGPAKITELEQ